MTLLWFLPATILLAGGIAVVATARRTAVSARRAAASSRVLADEIRTGTRTVRGELDAFDQGVRALQRRSPLSLLRRSPADTGHHPAQATGGRREGRGNAPG